MSLLDNLQHYWKCDEPSGTLADNVAGGLNAPLTIVGATQGVAGIIQKADDYDGINDGADDGGVATDIAQGSGDFTILLWIKDTQAGGGIPCAKQSGPGGQGFVINRGSSGSLEVFIVTSTGTHILIVGSGLNDGNFHQIGISREGTNLHAIIDGVRAGTITTATGIISNAAEPFRLGRRGNGVFYDGVVDEVGAWDVALSPAFLLQHFNGGAGFSFLRFDEPTAASDSTLIDAIAHWKFNDVDGTVVRDVHGQRFGSPIDLTIVGPTQGTPHKLGYGYSFDGVDDLVKVTKAASGGRLHFVSTAFFYSMWVSMDPNFTASGVSILNIRNGDTQYFLIFDSTSGMPAASQITWGVRMPDDSDITIVQGSGFLPSDGTPHHVLFGFDPSVPEIRLYVDGVAGSNSPKATTFATLKDTVIDFVIGAQASAGQLSKGIYGHVGVWGRAPTDQDAIDLFSAGNGLEWPFGVLRIPSAGPGIARY